MLAMKRFVVLLDEDFFKATSKPKELPKRATRKITAQAAVMPIMKFVEIPPDCDGATVCVVFLPNKKIDKITIIKYLKQKPRLSQTILNKVLKIKHKKKKKKKKTIKK